MPEDTPSWDHYRTFEAVVRHRSLTAAARALGVSQSTVSRHLQALEAIAGSPLLLRDGSLELTDRGASLLHAIAPIVEGALAARSALEETPELVGEVTVATLGELLRWVLAARLEEFFRAYPRLSLRILAGNALTSLAAGEADVSVRMSRPLRGDLVTRRLTRETFGCYAASTLVLDADAPWLGLAGSLASIPEQRYAEELFVGRVARLRVEDVETLGLAVQRGLGVAILPRQLALRLEGVVAVTPRQLGRRIADLPTRDVWLVVHPSKRRLPKVRAVLAWIEACFADSVALATDHRPSRRS